MTARRSLTLALLAASTLSLGQTGPGAPAITVAPIVETDVVVPGGIARVGVSIAMPAGLHLQSDRPTDPSVIPTRLAIDTPAGVTYEDVAFPATTEFRVLGFDQPLDVFEGDVVIGARLRIANTHPPGDLPIQGRVRYQACNDTACFPPKTVDLLWTVRVDSATAPRRLHPDLFSLVDWTRATKPPAAAPAPPRPAPVPAATGRPDDVLAQFDRFDVLGTTGYASPGAFVQFIRDAEAGVASKGLFEGRGPATILMLVFVGGLALNLTPCVLPMIPINLAIIGAGARAGRRGRGFLLGLTYGAAMAVVYGVLGVVVILTAGTFGTINASVWFNVAIAGLFVFLGLAMFDVFSLDFSRFSSRIRFSEQSRGTLYLAFGMGAVAALLAGACVAPVVVQVVVFASDMYARGTRLALALPFVLGLGMALPWPIAGAGLAALPKPGAWMVRVKQAMGVFILATAAYYAYTAYEIVSSRWVDPERVKASVAEQLKSGWHASLAEGLTIAEQKRTLVLVDFWATWCKNCLVMDRTTLRDPDVLQALRGYTLVKHQAEDPDSTPTKELLRRIEAVGLPVYAILRPKAAGTPPPSR
ncbi:MAG: thioredoxin family protein [Acidobacteria bacterium]|nr:thioredoxin family protein [Acidobacteriota bacterium]